MPIRLKNLVVILLVLALPTQGFAAEGMLACSPGHARMMAAPGFGVQAIEVAESAQHDHGTHRHAADSAHSAHDQSAQALSDAHAAQFVDVVGSPGALDRSSSSKCSACASCCFGAALVPGSVMPATPDLELSRLDFMSLGVVSFLTGGPIRPPRLFLA